MFLGFKGCSLKQSNIPYFEKIQIAIWMYLVSSCSIGVVMHESGSANRKACLTTDNGTNIVTTAKRLDWVRLC